MFNSFESLAVPPVYSAFSPTTTTVTLPVSAPVVPQPAAPKAVTPNTAIPKTVAAKPVSPSPTAAKPCAKPLQQNPFQTYRDPQTGRWMVLKPDPIAAEFNQAIEAIAEIPQPVDG